MRNSGAIFMPVFGACECVCAIAWEELRLVFCATPTLRLE
jgi:hypothetical protein